MFTEEEEEEEEEARRKYSQKGKTNFLVCWTMFVVWQCTVHDQLCSCWSWETRVNGENLEIMCRIASSQNLVHTSEQHAVVVHRIIDFHRRKRRMNQGICKQKASNPRIRSSCGRILTLPAKFDTSRRNHWRCLRRLSSTHLCWSCFGAGCRWNVLFLSTGLQQ
jgi:hypothetical protein